MGWMVKMFESTCLFLKNFLSHHPIEMENYIIEENQWKIMFAQQFFLNDFPMIS